MKYVSVSETKMTGIGLMRPGIPYALDEAEQSHAQVIGLIKNKKLDATFLDEDEAEALLRKGFGHYPDDMSAPVAADALAATKAAVALKADVEAAIAKAAADAAAKADEDAAIAKAAADAAAKADEEAAIAKAAADAAAKADDEAAAAKAAAKANAK